MYKIIWANLCPPGYNQEQVLNNIIRPSLNGCDELLKHVLASNATRTRFFCAQNLRIHVQMMGFLLRKYLTKSTDSYGPEDFEYWKSFVRQWKMVLDQLGKSERILFENHLQIILKGKPVPQNYSESTHPREGKDFWKYGTQYEAAAELSRISEILLKQSTENQLASMSLMALTWPLWEKSSKYKKELKRLSALIFPGTEKKTDTHKSSDEKVSYDESMVYQKISDIQNAAAGLNPDYLTAGKLCMELINLPARLSDYTMGQVLYLLGKCCSAGHHQFPLPPQYQSVKEIFDQAEYYGCGEAEKMLRAPSILEIRERSRDTDDGICIVNDENRISRLLDETRPVSWSLLWTPDPVCELQPNVRQRILLISDDFDKNLKDGLNILNYIQKDNKTDANSWNKLEVFLRCSAEKTAPIIDTALYFMESEKSFCIHVYLIDDARIAAQSLYAMHPVFYPFTYRRGLRGSGENKTVNLLILAGNPDLNLAEHLIREAFWFSVTLKEGHHTNITVLSPYEKELEARVDSSCPGLATFSFMNGDVVQREKFGEDFLTSFPGIRYLHSSMTEADLSERLHEIVLSADSVYYVIDQGKDLDNLQLAVRIREWDIRHTIHLNRIGRYAECRPVIAFHCEDQDYANLTRSLIVPKDENGNHWFNNYGLIPFGTLKTRYSWDMLGGGIIRSLAQSVHLQYSGCKPNPAGEYKELKSFFNRIYNRDSSYGAALSFPYRLFEADVFFQLWDIQNPDIYWTSTQRNFLADNIEKKIYPNGKDNQPDKALIDKLARYEHDRWCAFMLSRGWMPATAEETIMYMENGSPRHNLYLAKLHPCICKWEKLPSLQEILYRMADDQMYGSVDKNVFAPYCMGKNGYDKFTSIDLDNIEHTADLIRNIWFPEK